MRGRFTLALLRRVGLVGGIARSLEDLPAVAADVGREMAGARRAGDGGPRRVIATVARMMNEDAAPLHDWATFLVRAVGAAWRDVAEFGAACAARRDPACT